MQQFKGNDGPLHDTEAETANFKEKGGIVGNLNWKTVLKNGFERHIWHRNPKEVITRSMERQSAISLIVFLMKNPLLLENQKLKFLL